MRSRLLSLITSLCLAFGVHSTLLARDVAPTVSYWPQTENVEGDQPLFHVYELEITSPNNLPVGQNITITPEFYVISAPAGVSTQQALSHVRASPASVTFNGPSQKRYMAVISDFPVGTVAGEYAFGIRTPGWGVPVQDTFGFINSKVFPPRATDVPSITLNTPADGSVYYWTAGGPPVAIPVQFDATAPVDSPITSIDADISGSSVLLTNVQGIGTGAVTAFGNFYLAQGGSFTATARATNTLGTSSDSSDFTVQVIAPPPTASISQPTANATYTVFAGNTTMVPFTFAGVSLYGPITSLVATVNDQPVSVTPSGLGTLYAVGSTSIPVSTAGVYVLTVTATNPYGTHSATRSFNVNVTQPSAPPPTVTITSPVHGSVITRVAGSPATSVPYSFTAVAATGWNITAIGANFQGSPITPSASGLGTGTATGTGTLSVSAPGTYTLVATGTSNSTTAAASVTFSVVETAPPQAACGVNWLPPIQQGKVQKAGQNVSIKFELDCGEEWSEDRKYNDGDPDFYPGQRTKSKDNIDRSVVIAVFEVLANGNTTTPVLHTFSDNPNVPGYTIQGNDMYHLNFPTAKGARRYRIEIYRFPVGATSPQLVATKEFLTK